MDNANIFRKRVASGRPVIGANVTLSDPAVSEILSIELDFLWIDAEHNPLDLKAIEEHLMAMRGSECASLVRVPVGDLSVLKVVLDSGADGIVLPQVRSAEEVEALVSACRYPPEGTRGFGPRRAGGYGGYVAAEFCRLANERVMVFAQIEHIDAVNDLEAILKVPGLDGIVVGPFDLSNSMGHIANPLHPEVQAMVKKIITDARNAGVMVGIGQGDDEEMARRWISFGVQWISVGCDYNYLRRCARHFKRRLADGSDAVEVD